jgi:hypothetical protein
VSYCAESALSCTIIPDEDSLYRIESIQYHIFACSVLVRENYVASSQEFAGHTFEITELRHLWSTFNYAAANDMINSVL